MSNGNVRGTRYRPSISSPQHFYDQKELLQQRQTRAEVIENRKRRGEVFAETELGEVSVDDALHYQGHSQVQHSQLYGGGGGGGVAGGNGGQEVVTQQSLTKLTPFDTSQMMLQARGGISVDDDDEVSPVTKEPVQTGEGRESPFMHLSDNLSQTRNRSQNRSNEHSQDPVGAGESSQYSYLGLGVTHGSDVMFTNSMIDSQDLIQTNAVGAVGLSRDGGRRHEETMERTSYRTASPLLPSSGDEMLDETPTKETKGQSSSYSSLPRASHDIALLTSLESIGEGGASNAGKKERPMRSMTVSATTLGATGDKKKKTSLSSLTSLPRPEKSKATPTSGATPSAESDLQETPERLRSNTIATPEGSFNRAPAVKPTSSRLGKLTSLEYIRASLRMKLKKMKIAKDPDGNSPENPKKPLKSALRKTGSTSSYDSSGGASNTYTNHYASEYDESPQHMSAGPVMSPRYPFPTDYMGGHPPYGVDPMAPYDGGPFLHPPPAGPPYMDGYNYPISPQHLQGNFPPPPHVIYGADQLSPILSVSQMDYHPSMQVGLLPQYGHPAMMGMRGGAMGGAYDNYFPSQPPNYDDEDDDIPYRHTDMNVNASQRSVRWKLEDEEIPPQTPVDPEPLTPSDDDDHDADR